MANKIDKQTLLDLIVEAKRADPETGSFAKKVGASLGCRYLYRMTAARRRERRDT